MADQVHLPVISENDANAGAYAESQCGAGAGCRYMVYLTLGTGLGSGIVLNGRLYTGTSGYGGELGHTIIDPGGRVCACGRRGCLESIVSGTGIVATAREKMNPDEAQTAEMVFEAAIRGDARARRVFAETGKWLGIACANLINLLNPEVIVVAGGVMASGEMLLGAGYCFRSCSCLRSIIPRLPDSTIEVVA